MKKYCLDTSGFSTSLEHMPEDIHVSLWRRVSDVVQSGKIAATREIFDELIQIPGSIGQCIKDHKEKILLEIGEHTWRWEHYIKIVESITNKHRKFISEYNGNRKGTVGLNDISIVALAKTLQLPLISMESFVPMQPDSKRARIPNICQFEGVVHLSFSEFLRNEGISV